MSARHDEDAEKAVLGNLISGYGDPARSFRIVAAIVTRDDWWVPAHEKIWRALEILHGKSVPVDVVVVERVLRQAGVSGQVGGAPYLADLVNRGCPGPSLPFHAEAISAAAVLRRLAAAGQRIMQRAEADDADPATLASWAAEELSTARDQAAGSQLLTRGFNDWFAATPDTPPPLVPGMLYEGDRLVLTGNGGLGKSTLLAQFALCSAAGLPPLHWQTADPFTPVKVSIYDYENPDHKRKTRYWPIIKGLENLGLEPRANLTIGGTGNPFDVLNPQNAMNLLRTVERDQPQLVYIGPVYKLHNDDPDKEVVVKKITNVLDGIREMGAALITEAHPNKGAKAGGPLSPSGAALWEWWPEFGMGLRADPDTDEHVRRCKLERWRLDRDVNAWPLFVQASGDPALPWMESPIVPGYLVGEGEGGFDGAF